MRRAGYLIKWSLFAFGLRFLSIIIYNLVVIKIFHINIPDDNSTPDFILMVIVGPIIEELFFRGPIYLAVKFAIEDNELEEAKPLIFFMIFVLGVFFGLLHITNVKPIFSWGALWYATARIPGGIIYGWIVYRSKSLIPTIITHSMVNFTAYNVNY